MNVAAASAEGRVAPCLSGVDLLVEQACGAEPGGREIISTAGWGLVEWSHELLRRDVSVLLCSGIDQFLHGVLQGYGIAVIPHVAGQTDAVLRRWRSGAIRPAAPEDRGRKAGVRRARTRFRGGRHE